MNKVNINIKFSNDEDEIVSIIKDVIVKHLPQTKAYIVGGFVRDKLLGGNPNDMDIMIYPTDAETFANLITKHTNSKNPHVIKENPEKSKNISTCKVYLNLSSGRTEEIDIAQARKEVYTSESRNPEVEIATPEEDASRRDLTINSIFYDIVNGKIVDFTGKGIKDLISNVIRTPLDPLKTFKDDPLRIFRTIVFAAKYKGNIDPETYAAMSDPQLKEEIKKKISKERIGVELQKMFKNPNAEIAVELLRKTGLMEELMRESLIGTKYEGKMAPFDMDQNNPNHKLNWFDHTFEVLSNLLKTFPQYEGEKRIIMVLAALTHDMGKLFDEIRVKKPAGSSSRPGHEKEYTTYVGHEEESYEIAQHLLKYLKLEPLIQQVSGLARYHMMPHSLSRDSGGEKALRKFIRRMGEFSLNWLDVLNLSIADAYSKTKTVSPETIKEYKDLEQRLQAAMATLNVIPDSNKVKPILDGNEIMQILGIKPGAHMKELSEFIKELMDENPSISKEEATAKLKEKYGNQTLPYPQIKQASTCSVQTIKQKMMDIQDLIDNERTQEAISVITSLKENYGDDEKVTRLIAINTFKVIVKDGSISNNSLLQYIFNKASENFFDTVLNSYAFGLLLMSKTSTDGKVLREVANRVQKMSPGTLRFVVCNVPKERIINNDAASLVKDYIGE